jgi:putative aldouronate transport system substrate-binding protein
MNKKLCQVISFIITFTMLIAVVTACNGNQSNPSETTTAAPTSQSTTQATEGTTNIDTSRALIELPIIKDGSVTLKLSCYENDPPNFSYASVLPVEQEIEKNTGVKIIYQPIAVGQYNTTMQTILAAGGDDMPDIVLIPGDPTAAMKYAAAGVIIPLEELIAKNAPDLVKYYQDNPLQKALCYTSDGHQYVYQADISGSAKTNPYCFAIRQDWLDMFNLQSPVTTDDWYKVLNVFKTQDPNQNGKNDEIPTLAMNHVWWTTTWGWAFNLHIFYSNGWWADKDGKVQFEFISSNCKDFLAYMNKLYKEGLLDPDFMTTDSDKFNSKLNRNLGGSFQAYASALSTYNAQLATAGVTGKFVPTVPPKGPKGDQFAEVGGPLGGPYFGITSACTNPEVAVKWIDYTLGSAEGNTLLTFGIKGKSYTEQDGKKAFTDFVMKNPDGFGVASALRSIGALPFFPYIQTIDMYNAQFANDPELVAIIDKLLPYNVSNYPSIMSTTIESNLESTVMADIMTLTWEMMTRFVLGQDNLDDFDAKYVQKVKDMGIDKVIDLKQTQYDRLKKIMEQ